MAMEVTPAERRIRTRRPLAEHTLILGPQRCGKSTIATQLTEHARSCVVIDPTDEEEVRQRLCDGLGYVRTTDPVDITRFERVLYVPDIVQITDRAGWDKENRPGWAWTVALRAIWWRQDVVVRFPEGIDTIPSVGYHPELRRLITAGGKNGIALFVESQAPLYIAPVLFANARHCISFRFSNDDFIDYLRARRTAGRVIGSFVDENGIRRSSGDVGMIEHLPEHAYAWHMQGEDFWVPFGVDDQGAGDAETDAPIAETAESDNVEMSTKTSSDDAPSEAESVALTDSPAPEDASTV